METNSEYIVRRIRAALMPWQEAISEKRMFGGTCFLYKGKMCVGETKGRLMVRVLSEKMNEVRSHPSVSPMDFTGTPMKEFIFVSEEGFTAEAQLQQWIELGVEHAKTKSS